VGFTLAPDVEIGYRVRDPSEFDAGYHGRLLKNAWASYFRASEVLTAPGIYQKI
jgi:hypothetical protein